MSDATCPKRHHPARLAAVLAAAGVLSGCSGSGYYSYLGDTFTPPFGANPNVALAPSTGSADETYAKIRAARHVESPAPILYEAGDVWPPAPKAPPTLKDLQVQQNQEFSAGGQRDFTPLQPLPTLPGFDVPNQPVHVAAPVQSFPGGVVALPGGKHSVGTGGGADVKSLDGPSGNGSIVVPNGNGTSTVIGPNGSVSTVPTPGK